MENRKPTLLRKLINFTTAYIKYAFSGFKEVDVVATELNDTIYRIAGDGTEEHTAKIFIDYSIKDDVFGTRDFIIINL